ncbi:hypothetical protein Hanom_Chr17g01585021 [Helianthus anomalus]
MKVLFKRVHEAAAVVIVTKTAGDVKKYGRSERPESYCIVSNFLFGCCRCSLCHTFPSRDPYYRFLCVETSPSSAISYRGSALFPSGLKLHMVVLRSPDGGAGDPYRHREVGAPCCVLRSPVER